MEWRYFFFGLCLYSLGVQPAAAQVPIEMGVKAGPGFSDLRKGDGSVSTNSGYHARAGNQIAVFGDITLSKHLSLLPQLEYVSGGGCKQGYQSLAITPGITHLFPQNQLPDYVYADYKNEVIIRSVMVPILIKYRFTLGGRLKVYVAAGPFVSFVVAAHRQVTGNSVIYLDAQKTIQVSPEAQTLGGSQNIRDDLNHFNKGIAALAGVSYKLKKGKLLLEVGGNYGFYNIQRHEQEGTNYSYAAMLAAGYQLPLNYKPGTKRKMLE